MQTVNLRQPSVKSYCVVSIIVLCTVCLVGQPPDHEQDTNVPLALIIIVFLTVYLPPESMQEYEHSKVDDSKSSLRQPGASI